MTKMIMSLETGLRAKIERLIEAITEAIVNFEDYTLLNKISLSEFFFFIFASFRAVWFSTIGVENANFSYYFGNYIWIAAFLLTTAAHLAGMLARVNRLRVLSLYAHAFIWLVLTVIAALSMTRAAAVPTFLPLFLFSMFLIVRISREKPVETDD